MALVGDIAEVVHEQGYLGQVVNNVYFFTCVVDAPLTDLAAWFETNLLPQIRNCQVDLVTHVNLRLRNLFQIGEVYEEPLTGVGAVSSSTNELPSFMAYGLRLDHTNGAIRPGYKRIVGMDELSISDSVLTSARLLTLGSLGAMLTNPPTTANPNWAHIVVGRVCETPNPTPGAIPSCLKYRLPENLTEADFGIITSVEPFSQPTTQNSRKWYT